MRNRAKLLQIFGGRRIRRWGPVLVALAASFALSILVIPDLSVTGTPVDVQTLELGEDAETPGERTDGSVIETADGYVVKEQSGSTLSVLLRPPKKLHGTSVLRLWAYGGPDVDSTVRIKAADGKRRVLGHPGAWAPRTFDVTREARQGIFRVEFTVTNRSLAPSLVFDRAALSDVPPDSTTSASARIVALWVAMILGLVLAITGRLSHWPLAIAGALLTALVWPKVEESSFLPLSGEASRLWDAASDAKWWDVKTGLISGTFDDLSALAVQLLHALQPIVGEGLAGARAATVFISVLALAALYALGNRVAGRTGAIVLVAVVIAADPFRLAATEGTSLSTLVLAGALFAYGIHCSLAVASRPAVVILAGTGAIGVMADVVWLPGIVLIMGLLVWRFGTEGERLRVLGTGLLVLLILLIPNRLSVAERSGGDVLGDLKQRATLARNIEYVGEGHGAPSAAEFASDPFSGREVGLASYVFGDHSVSVVAGGTLEGAEKALNAFSKRDDSRLWGLIGFILALVGSLYLLIVPKLRYLILGSLLVAAPELFLVSRGARDPFLAATAVWPAFVAGAGVLLYALWNAYGEALRTRAHPVLGRVPRRGRRAPAPAGSGNGSVDSHTPVVGPEPARSEERTPIGS